MDSITVKLRDGNELAVKDCEFDLLLHLLYKYDFDKRKIDQEIEWICEKNDNTTVLIQLLKQSLRQFSSELSNKILAKSITESTNHRKIVEDMLLDMNQIHYSMIETPSEMKKLLQLRKKIFVGEEGYPATAVTNGYEKHSLHLTATLRQELVGCVSVAFDGPNGIPLDRFIDLKNLKKRKNVEVDKLAVIGKKRKRELSFQLMWLCYSVARFWGAERMFIFTLSKKEDNLNLYGRFGFKEIGCFEIFQGTSAIALMLDFDDVDTYEKHLETQQLLRLGKKLLNKFSLQHQKLT